MATQPNSKTIETQFTELSNDELDEVSGGVVNISFTLLLAEESNGMTSQKFPGHSNIAGSGSKRRSLFGLQISGSFESMDHFSSFLSKLMQS